MRRFLFDLRKLFFLFDIRKSFFHMTRTLGHNQALGQLFIDLVAQRVADMLKEGVQNQMYDVCFCLWLELIRVPCSMASLGVFWILK